MNYKITKNGKDLVTGLTKEQAVDQLFAVVEDHASGYIWDNEDGTIYHEVDGRIVARKGDESVRAGDNYFQIVEENE